MSQNSSRGFDLEEAYRDRIVIDPRIRFGKPTVRGTRITVGDVLGYFAAWMSEDEILSNFPQLSREDLQACFAFAADRERELEESTGDESERQADPAAFDQVATGGPLDSVTEAVDTVVGRLGASGPDLFVTAAARRILEGTEWLDDE